MNIYWLLFVSVVLTVTSLLLIHRYPCTIQWKTRVQSYDTYIWQTPWEADHTSTMILTGLASGILFSIMVQTIWIFKRWSADIMLIISTISPLFIFTAIFLNLAPDRKWNAPWIRANFHTTSNDTLYYNVPNATCYSMFTGDNIVNITDTICPVILEDAGYHLTTQFHSIAFFVMQFIAFIIVCASVFSKVSGTRPQGWSSYQTLSGN